MINKLDTIVYEGQAISGIENAYNTDTLRSTMNSWEEEKMYLSKRSDILLKDLLIHRRRSNKELQIICNLSRRQVDYGISKLNQWLQEKSYPCIEHTSSGHFVVPARLLKLLGNLGDAENKVSDWYISSPKERRYAIILKIIMRDEPLSVNHFISELEVSRNTILRDLKEISIFLERYQLSLAYSRKEGYQIVGKEWDERFILNRIINYLINIYGGETYLQHFMGISQSLVNHWRDKLEKVETQLKLKFTDVKMQILPYVFESIFKRIEQSHAIEDVFFTDYEGLSDTREYTAAEQLIRDRRNISKKERMYLTLQVLTSNIIPSKDFMFDEIPQLEQATKKCLNLFETNTCIKLPNKKTLLEKLMIHLKPAYYRIKYHLNLNYTGLQQISQEYQVINYFVKKSLTPLNELIGESFPDEEILFISLFIGSHLINFGNKLNAKLKAAVVCANGISFSLLMEKTLKNMFPDMLFYKAMSVREFGQFRLPCDVVFSSVPIDTKAKLFVVKDLMNDAEKMKLKHSVFKSIYHFDEGSVDVDEMIKVVEKYAEIHDKDKLKSSIIDFITRKDAQSKSDESGKIIENEPYCHLHDLLFTSMIHQVNEVDSWSQAIDRAAQPLISHGFADKTYLDRLQYLYKKPVTQIILGNSIALPHAEPEYGINKLAMSLLHIKKGLQINPSLTIYFVVVLAAVDKKAHFNALLELTRIAQSPEYIASMKVSESCDDLYFKIKQFDKEVANYIFKNHVG